jgi:SNF2 family DNA or RNA helicase
MADDFPYKTTPFGPYQRDILVATMRRPFAYLAMEQGTGKSWETINTMVYLYLAGKITGAIVVAPNNIHAQWALEQLPAHMSDRVPWRAHIWESGPALADFRRGKKKKRAWAVEEFINGPGFPILCVNSESVTRPLTKRAITLMLKTHKCLFAVDEAGDFSGNSKRTRAIMRWRHMAPYRRMLEGVLVGGSPFELYYPYRFLSPSILGYNSYGEMKEKHAEWIECERTDGKRFKIIATNRDGSKKWKDLDKLAERIKPHTFRALKKDVLPFLPKKLFHKRFFELTKEQWRLTSEIAENYTTEIAGGSVTATIRLTQYLRWQQIACGYVPLDPDYATADPDDDAVQPVAVLPGPNPRLDLLAAELRGKIRPTVIWCRFHYDIDLISDLLDAQGFRFVTYDGRIDREAKQESKERFRDGDVDFFLANTKAGGRGLDGIQRANRVFYYSNYFGLRPRLQSEDRTHRIGTGAEPVDYTDLLARSSIDMLIVRALRNNQNVADAITGDPAKEWI